MIYDMLTLNFALNRGLSALNIVIYHLNDWLIKPAFSCVSKIIDVLLQQTHLNLYLWTPKTEAKATYFSSP